MEAVAKVTDLNALRQAKVESATSVPVTVGFDTLAGFELTQRVAKMFSMSSLMPKDFQGNLANCAIALNMAARLGADPLMVAQNLYVVHGRPGWSAQFLIATFNKCGRFSSLRYEFTGQENTDEWSCRAWAIEKDTGDRLDGTTVSIGMAKKEGWYTKNGSKWQTMPQQMLMYRAASWFIRAYAPEIAMGLHTAEEVRDTWDLDKDDSTGTYTIAEVREQAQNQEPATSPAQPAEQAEQPQGQEPEEHKRARATKAEVEAYRAETMEMLQAKGVTQEQAEQAANAFYDKWTKANCDFLRKHNFAVQPAPAQAPATEPEQANGAESSADAAFSTLPLAERRRRIGDFLAGNGVIGADIVRAIGKTLDQASPDDCDKLIQMCDRINCGESPADVFA